MYNTYGHELNFVHKRFIGAGKAFLGGGGLGGALGGFLGGGAAGNGGQTTTMGRSCSPPYFVHPQTGRCTLSSTSTGVGTQVTSTSVPGPGTGSQFGPNGGPPQIGTRPEEGWRAFFERLFPGGETGTELATEGYGNAVIGGFGIPALEPAIVGAVQRRDGTMAPIRRCPPGLVLATDELCYAKGTRGLAAHRKWKPSGACFLPPRDVKALRRAVAIRKSKSNRAMFKELGLG